MNPTIGTDIPVLQCDVLVIGTEAAGAKATIEAHTEGVKVVAVTKGQMGRSGATIMAGPGVQAPLGHMDPRDNPEVFLSDVVKGGVYLNNQKLVERLVNLANSEVLKLEKWGARFRKREDGKFFQSHQPGSTYPRGLNLVGGEGGIQYRKAFKREFKRQGIVPLQDVFISKLLLFEGQVAGAQPPAIAKTDEQVYDFFKYIAERVNIGIGIFNNPMLSGMMLKPTGIAKLADLENVVVTKEAYPNLLQIINVHKTAGEKIVVSSPRDDIFFYSLLYGFKQQVVFANALDWMCDTPQKKSRQQYLDLVSKGDMLKAMEIYQKHIKPGSEVFDKWFYFFTNQGIFPSHFCKYWGELIGMAGGPVRVPTMQLTPQQKKSIREDLERIGLIK